MGVPRVETVVGGAVDGATVVPLTTVVTAEAAVVVVDDVASLPPRLVTARTIAPAAAAARAPAAHAHTGTLRCSSSGGGGSGAGGSSSPGSSGLRHAGSKQYRASSGLSLWQTGQMRGTATPPVHDGATGSAASRAV